MIALRDIACVLRSILENQDIRDIEVIEQDDEEEVQNLERSSADDNALEFKLIDSKTMKDLKAPQSTPRDPDYLPEMQPNLPETQAGELLSTPDQIYEGAQFSTLLNLLTPSDGIEKHL